MLNNVIPLLNELLKFQFHPAITSRRVLIQTIAITMSRDGLHGFQYLKWTSQVNQYPDTIAPYEKYAYEILILIVFLIKNMFTIKLISNTKF